MQNCCRPLIAFKSHNPQFFDLPYDYLPSHNTLLNHYMSRNLIWMGTDFLNPSSQLLSKYKSSQYLSVKGINTKDNKPLKFLKLSQVHPLLLKVHLGIQLSMDTNLGSTTTQIKNKVQNNLIIFSRNSEGNLHIYDNDSIFTFFNMKNLTLEATITNKTNKSIHKMPKADKCRVFKNQLTVIILMNKNKSYGYEEIKNIICQDLCYGINQMQLHNVYKRQINFHRGVIPILHYYRKNDHIENYKSLICKQSDSLLKSIQLENPSQKNGNVIQFVMLILVLIVVIFGYLKLRQII